VEGDCGPQWMATPCPASISTVPGNAYHWGPARAEFTRSGCGAKFGSAFLLIALALLLAGCASGGPSCSRSDRRMVLRLGGAVRAAAPSKGVEGAPASGAIPVPPRENR
jgi:hypothetical protein